MAGLAVLLVVVGLVVVGLVVVVRRTGASGEEAAGSRPGPTPSTRPGAAAPGIRVAGNRLVDPAGRPVRLAGVNLSGGEYACIEGFGFFDTPEGSVPTDAQVAAIAAWPGLTAVRVPLNEQCWLGIGGVRPEYGGTAYRAAVGQLVSRLTAHGLITVLDLHRSAPGAAASRNQEPMPDRDHSADFWRSVAAAFSKQPAVAFDLFNEPWPYGEQNSTRAWACWRDGGCRLTSANTGRPYVAAGMQELLDAVRSTGARNVVFAGGVYWAQGVTQWLTYRPRDHAGQLAAAFHVYSFNNYCVTTTCFDRDLRPILAQVPLLAGEVGPDLPADIRNFDAECPSYAVGRSGFARRTLDWLDAQGAGWTAWAWTPTGDCWSIAADWTGRATAPWGTTVRARLAPR